MATSTDSRFPWRDGLSIEAVVERHRSLLESSRLIWPAKRCLQIVIDAADRQLAGGLPAELRAFYRCAEPIAPFTFYDTLREPSFYPPGPQVSQHRLADEVGASSVGDAIAINIGQCEEGMPIFIVRQHPVVPDESIMRFDEGHLFVLARSLAEYIGRICFYGGVDPIFQPSSGAAFIENLGLIRAEMIALNPDDPFWLSWNAGEQQS